MENPWVAGLVKGYIPEVGWASGPLLIIPRCFVAGQAWEHLCASLPGGRAAYYIPPERRLDATALELRMLTGSRELAEVWEDLGANGRSPWRCVGGGITKGLGLPPASA